MSSICSQTGYTVLVSVNLSPFPSLVDAQVFNNNVMFFNLLPNSCPWLLCRLTSFCLKSHMNVGKCSRIVAAVHYWGHQEFLSLVKSRMKKLKEKEWVCCSVTNKKRLLLGVDISWLHGGRGAVDAVPPISTAWSSTCSRFDEAVPLPSSQCACSNAAACDTPTVLVYFQLKKKGIREIFS